MTTTYPRYNNESKDNSIEFLLGAKFTGNDPFTNKIKNIALTSWNLESKINELPPDSYERLQEILSVYDENDSSYEWVKASAYMKISNGCNFMDAEFHWMNGIKGAVFKGENINHNKRSMIDFKVRYMAGLTSHLKHTNPM